MFIPCLSLKPLLSAAKVSISAWHSQTVWNFVFPQTQQASCTSTTRFMLELRAAETWCPQRSHLLQVEASERILNWYQPLPQLWQCLRVALVVLVHLLQHLMRTSTRSRRGEETPGNGGDQVTTFSQFASLYKDKTGEAKICSHSAHSFENFPPCLWGDYCGEGLNMKS